MSKLTADITGIKPSQTAINRGLSKVCDNLELLANEIAHEVMNSDYINIDETGHKLVLEGKKHGSKKIWVWVFANKKAAYYHVDMTRSQSAIKTALEFRDKNKQLPISVSDAYPAYLNTFNTKQFCWAHLLRESKDLETSCFHGKILHDRLVDIFQKVKSTRKKLQKGNEQIYQTALEWLYELAYAESNEKTQKLQKHLKKRAEHYVTCLRYPQVPMTNNHAEQLLKTVIVHRSNGKPLRSELAMHQYGILLTVLTTWKLRGLPVGETLREFLQNHVKKERLISG